MLRAVDLIHSVLIISTALGVPERIFAVLYVGLSIKGLTRCYKTAVFTFIFEVFLLNLFYRCSMSSNLFTSLRQRLSIMSPIAYTATHSSFYSIYVAIVMHFINFYNGTFNTVM